jgi:SAM-dependent methyltransferase
VSDAWWATFFDATYRALWAERTTPERTRLEVDGIEQVLAAHGIAGPARILDLFCGDGRIGLELAVRGHDVTGLDRSASMLAAARERSLVVGARIELVEEDARLAHRLGGHFDVVACWGSSFGYFEETADDLEVLEAIRRVLRPGGVLLLETAHRDRIAIAHASDAQLRDWWHGDGYTVLRERWFDPTSGRAGEDLQITLPDGTRERRGLSLRAYTATELVALCRAADLHDPATYGGPGPTAFGLDTRLLLVARRAPT